MVSMLDDVEAADLRRSARARVVLDGKICLKNGTSVACKIRDLSAGGAKIEVLENVKLPDTFDLVIFEVKFRICRSQLRWRGGKFAGVSFKSDNSA